MKSRTFLRILEELGWPRIVFVHPRQFAKLPGGWDLSVEGNAGGAIEELGVVTVAPWVRGKARTNTLWHETGHILWPKKPEWWMLLFGQKMAGGGGVGKVEWLQDHTADELPSRARLLQMAIRAGKRYNAESEEG